MTFKVLWTLGMVTQRAHSRLQGQQLKSMALPNRSLQLEDKKLSLPRRRERTISLDAQFRAAELLFVNRGHTR